LYQTSSNAACAPGQVSAASSDPALAGGEVIARGSLYGSPWKFIVATAACHPTSSSSPRSATSFGLVGANGLTCGAFTSPTSEFRDSEANVTVENLPSGQRVACGSVPSEVSSVTVTSQQGAGVSEPVLSAKRVGSAFFVISLGKVGAICYYVCKGSVTVNLYSGSSLISSHRWQELATETSSQSYGVRS
jgi:hypothetical protein